MEELKEYDIPFDIKELKHRADLIEQDGPLLSLYYNLNFRLICSDNTHSKANYL